MPNELGEHIFNMVSNIDEIAEAVARKKFSKSIFEGTKEIGGFQLPAMMEQTPDPSNRIKLGSEKDAFGLTRIAIEWELKQDDRERVWKTLEILAQEVGALSLGRLKLLRERSPRIWNSMLGFSQHHMGTTRMASSPTTGVVDENCSVFGTQNLFIAGSSVFPTGSHVPPTLTITALSIRLARHLQTFLGLKEQ